MGAIKVAYNSHLTLAAVPDAGYVVDHWIVDGRNTKRGGETLFLTFLQTDHTVRVTFKDPLSEGTVQFNNRVPPFLDARVVTSSFDGRFSTDVSEGFTAQLYGGPGENSHLSAMKPLFPTTTFRTGYAAGYVNPVVVAVPGSPPGSRVTLVMRVFNGPTFESSTSSGTSNPINVTLGGGLLPPAPLVGLAGFVFPFGPSLLPAGRIQPASETAFVGDRVTFNMTLEPRSFTVGVSFQWLFNGTLIPGATSPSLTLQNVQQNHAGDYAVRVMNLYGSTQSAAARLTVVAPSEVGDFDGDGQADLLFQDAAGFVAAWLMDGSRLMAGSFLTPNQVSDLIWRMVGAGDFNRDGRQDVLFQHDSGKLNFWHMIGVTRISSTTAIFPETDIEGWRAVATGDFNGDGRFDVILQHTDGSLMAWLLDQARRIDNPKLDPSHPGDAGWRVVGAGDFNRDGKPDLVFQHVDGDIAVWMMDGTRLIEAAWLEPPRPDSANWRVASVADLNRDGSPDLVFQHATESTLAVWYLAGRQVTSAALLNPSQPGGTWRVRAP
ncbi:MAG: VCBS repeat-containing protein [Verrucomicrobia bacterium]|nr:VCBS repeat-containing protein [Verrucomicrobiota bacterium]